MPAGVPLASRWAEDTEAVATAVKQDKKVAGKRFAGEPTSRESHSRESDNTQFSDSVEEVSDDSDWETVPALKSTLSKDAQRLLPVKASSKVHKTPARQEGQKSQESRYTPKEHSKDETTKAKGSRRGPQKTDNSLLSRIDPEWKVPPLQSRYADPEPTQRSHKEKSKPQRLRAREKDKSTARGPRSKKTVSEDVLPDPSLIQKKNAQEFEKMLDQFKLGSSTGDWADDFEWY
ncbi:hypothetical protein KL905_002165 [Ogataea polymorpha]|uniref:uncharacterized protein n=1 Tax=Ogataea polymorpha TaxID=460523 RepID=UPI0007F51145|nr:uncharacterized protein OGAPODRAFT_95274 [Ogataea polymorpha]KAG7901330.1 hypothetical protein KL935_002396 [Ogataea polymorpha]KAG7905683.1 hypothetical protein KL907_002830 [Ogataea polymorpha]KAG7922143.1 hypothetical protein KL905_002165 [Ogataea polymorpha]KAG7936335.1 hypothetical protein KL934_001802 [Ogataea polymorpha]OBA14203.1 hypothetical protein OGAPODRAFT_95274 [Ogataea polymorpha]